MNAKDYLLQVEKLNRMIESKKQSIERWKSIAYGMGVRTDNEKVQSSPNQKAMETAITNYTDLIDEVMRDIVELAEKTNKITDTLGAAMTSDAITPSEFHVLDLHYLQGMDFYSIASVNAKSYSWATTTHSRGLIKFELYLTKREILHEL